MGNVLLLGESWVTHMIHQKGFDTFTTTEYVEGSGPFTAALTGRGWQVTHVPAHEIESRFPATAEELAAYDCVVISDVGVNTFQLTRKVFNRSEQDIDRLGMIADYVRAGGGLIMVGGYLSFSGIDAKARYGSSVLADLLPVEVLDHDDRVEVPGGVTPRTVAEHEVLDGVPAGWPHVLGYNRTVLREGSTLVAQAGDDPFIAVRAVDEGRTAVFTSDMSAHWAPPAFTGWAGYPAVWDGLVSWVSATARVPAAAQG